MELRVNALDELEDFPAQLRELRHALELSQVELAYKLGVAPRTVQYWEAGKVLPHPQQRRALKALIEKGPA
jgi:DNA-binding transcriptional regulator YiaG